jgi:phage baseplate assembly protein W
MGNTTQTTKYGTALPVITEKGVGSKYKAKIGCTYPLVVDIDRVVDSGSIRPSRQPAYFGKSSELSLVRNNLRQLLLTERGERVMLPDYGVSVRQFLFEPLDQITYMLIRRDILSTIAKYMSIVKVLSLKVYTPSFQSHQLVVSLTLQLLDESLDIFDVEVKIGS